VYSCSHWLRPRKSSPPPHLGSYTKALLVSQERRHFFVNSWSETRSLQRIFTRRRFHKCKQDWPIAVNSCHVWQQVFQRTVAFMDPTCMIYSALYVMLLMWAKQIHWALNGTRLTARCNFRGPKKSRFPGPNPLPLAQVMDLPASKALHTWPPYRSDARV
jgi:hypothetical protein